MMSKEEQIRQLKANIEVQQWGIENIHRNAWAKEKAEEKIKECEEQIKRLEEDLL